MKTTQNIDTTTHYKHRPNKNEQSTTAEFKKQKCSICNDYRLVRKHRLTQSNKLHGRNHENFIQLWKTDEDAIGFQFNPAVNVINLSTKTFNRDVFKLLNKNSHFLPMQKYFSKTNFFNGINGFYWRMKLEAHFKDQANKPETEKDVFRKSTDKIRIPQKTRHTVETVIEATDNEISKEIAPFKRRTRTSKRSTGKIGYCNC